MKKAVRFIVVFLLGGILYSLAEVLFRGYTHWTMLIAGGFVFYVLYEVFGYIGSGHIMLKCVIGCVMITSAEYLAGAVLNIVLKMHIWDYSEKPYNLFGQICPAYSACWFFLSIPAAGLIAVIKKHLH